MATTTFEAGVMGIGLTHIHHVKIPVTDLARSTAWYIGLLDLVPLREFVEQGALRGVALRSPEGGFAFALRQRQYCAGQPDLTGFDLVAVGMASREALADLVARCDRLGIGHGPMQDRGPDEAAVDVPDPDATVLRFLWDRGNEEALRFIGLCFHAGAPPTLYATPRLPTLDGATADTA